MLEPSDSFPSSKRLSISSGFALGDDIDVTVLRRSVWLLGSFEACGSTLAEELLDNQENGPASFLGGSAEAGDVLRDTFGFGAGGGPQGTAGRDPENPCGRKGSFEEGGDAGTRIESEAGSSILTSLGVKVVVLSLSSPEVVEVPGAGTIPGVPSCTSSREEVEIRWAESDGDFLIGAASPILGTLS